MSVTPAMPPHRDERTGNVVLDRIQENVRKLFVTLAALLAVQPIGVCLAADFTTTSANPVNTPLRLPVKAGEVWDIEFFGRGACSSVNGMGYAFGAPPGSTVSGVLYSSSTNTLVANWLLLTFSSINTAIGTCHAGANTTPRPDSFNARVKVAQDGFIIVQAYAVTAGTTATVVAQSMLRGKRIAEVQL